MNLRLSSVRQASGSRFAANQTVLSLSWFHGRLRAVAVQHGEIEGTWEGPEGQEDPRRFAEGLREAVQKLVGRPVNFQATSSLVLYTRDVLLNEPYYVAVPPGDEA